VVVISFNTL